ncbi:MAG: Fis family transcriptional regulator [Methylococcaceae bacterium]|nr:Fis family transcriptional regulator [Methylococcaceae bacterium]
MKKTDKKIDKQICRALTNACETAKVEVLGFQWLTHLVNYNQFPESLSVICIFDTKSELEQAYQSGNDQLMFSLIKSEFEQINIRFKALRHHVSFDTEEACETEHNGNWQQRLNRRKKQIGGN